MRSLAVSSAAQTILLCFPLERATLKNIRPILKQHIDPSSHLVTDESVVYQFTKPDFAKHSTVNHARKEYVRREENFKVTSNTVESFFALLKRFAFMRVKADRRHAAPRGEPNEGETEADEEATLNTPI